MFQLRINFERIKPLDILYYWMGKWHIMKPLPLLDTTQKNADIQPYQVVQTIHILDHAITVM